ncbi:hypothetical protein PFISCL1PPCAC_17799, partial [Pristionchus fissidentatus]
SECSNRVMTDLYERLPERTEESRSSLPCLLARAKISTECRRRDGARRILQHSRGSSRRDLVARQFTVL